MKSKKALRQVDREERSEEERERRAAKKLEAPKERKKAEPKADANRQEHKLQVYCTEEQKAFVEFKKEQGITSSQLIRLLLQFAIDCERGGIQTQELARTLRRPQDLRKFRKFLRKLDKKEYASILAALDEFYGG